MAYLQHPPLQLLSETVNFFSFLFGCVTYTPEADHNYECGYFHIWGCVFIFQFFWYHLDIGRPEKNQNFSSPQLQVNFSPSLINLFAKFGYLGITENILCNECVAFRSVLGSYHVTAAVITQADEGSDNTRDLLALSTKCPKQRDEFNWQTEIRFPGKVSLNHLK